MRISYQFLARHATPNQDSARPETSRILVNKGLGLAVLTLGILRAIKTGQENGLKRSSPDKGKEARIMAYWKGEEILVFFRRGEPQKVVVLNCERGRHGWKLLCQPGRAEAEPNMVVWDSAGKTPPPDNPVVEIHRTGVLRPRGSAA